MSLRFSPTGGMGVGAIALTIGAGTGFGSDTFTGSTGFAGSACLTSFGRLTNDTSTDVIGRSPCCGSRSPAATSKTTTWTASDNTTVRLSRADNLDGSSRSSSMPDRCDAWDAITTSLLAYPASTFSRRETRSFWRSNTLGPDRLRHHPNLLDPCLLDAVHDLDHNTIGDLAICPKVERDVRVILF